MYLLFIVEEKTLDVQYCATEAWMECDTADPLLDFFSHYIVCSYDMVDYAVEIMHAIFRLASQINTCHED